METAGNPYEKSDILVIAEQIYEIKGKLQDLNLALEDEKFHARYIPKRRELAYTQSASRMFYIILLSAVVIICFIGFLIGACMGSDLGNFAIFLIPAGGVVIFGGYVDFKLIRQQMAIFPLLHLNFNEEKALRYSSKKNITTYQSDEIASKRKIALLESGIEQLSEKLGELEQKQQELICNKEEREALLKEKGILVENENKAEIGGLSLKQSDDFGDNIQELFELYSSEENYISKYLDRLLFRLEEINREIVSIEDNFQLAKRKILIGIICFFFLVVLQSVFNGGMEKLFVLFSSILSIFGMLYLDKTCSGAIVTYFVEHESKWTSEYAFLNNLVPVRYKREELLALIEQNQKELKEIKKKKDALD